MLDKHITFTYGELIDAFNHWNKIIDSGSVPNRPIGNNYGEMFTNYLINTINEFRKERLTTYDK